jgi:hypothetical protein
MLRAGYILHVDTQEISTEFFNMNIKKTANWKLWAQWGRIILKWTFDYSIF